jgi:hypothetical protein
MKVVLLCGGLGLHLRKHAESFPKADGVGRLLSDPVAWHEVLRPHGHRDFVLRPEIFNHMEDGDELVFEPFQRLITKRKSTTYPTRASGCQWTPFETGRNSNLSSSEGRRLGRSGPTRRPISGSTSSHQRGS